MRERTITIDMDEGNYRILRYKQYDNNNILKIIIQENKEEVDLAFYTARLFFKLPSGSILEKDTTIENNRIIVSIDSGILSENGRIIADLTLSSSEQLVTAFTMYLDVEETIDRNEAVQSKPEWDLITNTLNNLDTKVDKVEGKSLIANSEIERLANVDNYDDTELKNLIDTKSDTTHNHDTQYASKSSEHIHDNKNALDKVTDSKVIEWDNKSDFSGSYEDLTDKPTIPVVDVNKVYVDEQLSNKSDINHTHTELHTHNNKDVLDVITQEKINEWNSKSDFSGDYNDLINKPIIPTLDGYATENYVKNAIADAQLNGGGGGGTGSIDLSGYATKDELNAKANVSDIPTKTSQLENDSRFLTSVPSEYITETELNAKRYLTQHQDISGKVDKVNGKSLISNSEIERLANMEDNANNYVHPSTHKASMIVEDNTHRFITDLERVNWNNKVDSNQLHEHSNKDVLDGITSDKVANWDKAEENVQSDWNTTDTTSDAYIKNKPSIPSKVSELTNDNLYATETYVRNKIAEAQVGGSVDLSEYALKVDLNEKVDKVSGKGLSTNDYTNEEKNKLSNLSTVATSGNYNDLTNKPSIPTKTSQLTNDSSFASESYVTDAINNAQLGGGDGSSVDLSAYQTKSDTTLTTDSKTIVGAINELDTKSIKSVDYSTIDTTIGNDVSNRLTELETKCIKAEDYENSSVIIENNLTSRVSVLETNKADKTYVDEQLANVSVDLSDYQTKSDATLGTTNKTIVGAINELNTNKANKTEIPTKTSDLTNDSNFATESYVTNAINNASIGGGEGTSVDLSVYQTKTDNTLNTTDKTIVGAINELDIESVKAEDYSTIEMTIENDVNTRLTNLEITKVEAKDYNSGVDITIEQNLATRVNTLESNVNELFQSVSSGKTLIASAITDKGIETSSDATFQTMADNIGLIEGNGNAPSWYGNLPSWYTPETIIWVKGKPIPTELVYPLSGKINDYIYVITSQSNYNYNYCYNTNDNTWETKTPTTEIKSEACSLATVNDKIYCVGGTSATTLCYDPSTDTWSIKTNITTPRLHMSVESVGNIIYCISGYINSTSTYTATHECYDVLTDTWTSKSGMSGRAETGSGVVDSNIYVFGGWNGSKVVNTNECYNTLTDTWSVKTVMPSECRQFTASEIDDNIYCMVGTTNYCYNVGNNNWSEKTSVPTNAVDTTSVSIGNKIYCFGGRVYSGSNYNYSSRNECYIANNDN